MSDDTKALREPDGYAYQYDGYSGPVIRFDHGEGYNGQRPFRAIPYWFDAGNSIERLERELAAAREDGDAYHRVMSLLGDLQLEHGRCEPRWRRACTRCNASDDLAAVVKAYRGPRVVLSEEDWQ